MQVRVQMHVQARVQVRVQVHVQIGFYTYIMPEVEGLDGERLAEPLWDG